MSTKPAFNIFLSDLEEELGKGWCGGGDGWQEKDLLSFVRE